jgi:phospholipid transport system substrate-binding protein
MVNILRRAFLVAVAAASFSLAGVVAPAHAEADPEQAKALVQNLSRDAVKIMTSKGLNDTQRIDQFRTLFIGSVDLPAVSKFILGRHWKTASPQQQQDFMHLFEEMLVYTWANRFKDASDNITVAINGVKPDGEDGAIVDSSILRAGQEPIPVLWRLRQSDGGLKIIDLLIEGTSMIVTYREEYASVINQSGGKIDGLLDVLRQKTVALAAAQTAKPGPGSNSN